MNVLVVADGHYFQTPDGTVYAESVFDYTFYKRYLLTFDHVYAAVRLVQIDETPSNMKKSSGEGLTFLPIPSYRGPKEYIRKYREISRCVKKYCEEYDCAIFRIPAATSNIFCKKYVRRKKPFAVEVVIDPWENFGPGATGNRFMLFVVRRNWTNLVKKMCREANGASYVTEKYLQNRYPPRAFSDKSGKFFTEFYSSVELPDDSFELPRKWDNNKSIYWISHVANSFTGYGKGHITLMNAVKEVNQKDIMLGLDLLVMDLKKMSFKNMRRSLEFRIELYLLED